jgi:Uma2 family endonuclease
MATLPGNHAEQVRRLTEVEWATLDEDQPGELVDGVLEDEEVPDWIHEVTVAWLISVVRAWVVARGGFVAGSEAKYLLRGGGGRKPDMSAFLPGTNPPPRRGPVRRPPDIMVEVVSPTPRDIRRDRMEKMIEYARFGVRYYWLVDPEARLFEIYELGDDRRYAWVLGASRGTVASVPGCQGLELDLDALWAEIDRLGPEEPEEV